MWTWGYLLLYSVYINTQINLLTGIMTFFFFNNTGLIRAKRVIIDLFSGLLLPIPFIQFGQTARHVPVSGSCLAPYFHFIH